MIGSALIEECVKHDIEVYAVLRSASGKQDRLPDSSLVHLIDSSLETLEELPELIPQGCDTFYHIAWGNTGENRNRSTELQSRNIGYTLAAVRAAKLHLAVNALSGRVLRQSTVRWMWKESHRTVRRIHLRRTVQASWHPAISRECSAGNWEWNVSGRGFSVFMGSMRKKRR